MDTSPLGNSTPPHQNPKKPGIYRLTAKGLTVILVLLIIALLALVRFTVLGDRFFRSPQKVFNATLADTKIRNEYTKDHSITGGKLFNLTVESAITQQGDLKEEKQAQCTFDTKGSAGRVTISYTFININDVGYSTVNSIKGSKFTAAQQQASDKTYGKQFGMWKKTLVPLETHASIAQNGFFVRTRGVWSNTFSSQQIMDAFTRNHVFRILDARRIGKHSDRYYVMTVYVNKEAYDHALSDLKMDYAYRQPLLRDIFWGQEAVDFDIAVRVTDHKVLWSTYQTDNWCAPIAKTYGVDVSDAATHIRFKSEIVPTTNALKLKAPSKTIN